MTKSAIDARDMVLSYGPTIAIAESTFSIPAGTTTVVIGPNGSGKSTLLSAIAGLIQPTRGSIAVAASRAGTNRISYVLQTTKVNDALPISVYEVVAMGRYADKGAYRRLDREDRDAIDAAMKRVGITDLARRHINDLSGGQRQRVFVAQGLAQSHDLLLLDEPLTGIDLTTAQAIDRVIHQEVDDGCTVVITTHDLSEASVADHVILLSGKVIASGPPSDVLTSENLSAAYGATLLHMDDEFILLDDAAHRPVDGRHVHRDRSNRD